MRILTLTNLYPPFYVGGYELRCAVITEALRQRGHEVHVLTRAIMGLLQTRRQLTSHTFRESCASTATTGIPGSGSASSSGGLAGLGVGQGLGEVAPSFTGDVSKTAYQFSADRQAISDALYTTQTKYLGDQFARDDENLRSQLLSRGLTEGSAANDNALRDQQRTQNDAYGTAANYATTQSAQMQKLMQDALLNSAMTQQISTRKGSLARRRSRTIR